MPTSSDRKDERPAPARPRGVAPGILWRVVAGIVALGLAALLVIAVISRRTSAPLGRVSRAVGTSITFAGSFPPVGSPRLLNPRGAAWDGQRLYVAEADAGRLRRFTKDGRDDGAVVVPPAVGNDRAYPVDVAAVGGGRLAVVDTAGRRVVVIPAVGGGVPLVLGSDAMAVSPGAPTAVTSSNGEILVADAEDKSILVYDQGGRFRRRLGRQLAPRLTYVSGMTVLRHDLYVSDSDAGRVLRLDLESGVLRGVLPVRFDLPRGIRAATSGTVFVVDTFARAVWMAGPSGVTLDEIGTRGRSPGGADLASTLGRPEGVVWLEHDGRLFVTDAENGDVRVYQIGKELTAPGAR